MSATSTVTHRAEAGVEDAAVDDGRREPASSASAFGPVRSRGSGWSLGVDPSAWMSDEAGGERVSGSERRHALGPEGDCVCPRCEARIPHRRGVRCEEERCPSCGIRMLREGSEHHRLWLMKHDAR
jgi:hypothetical protein